MKTTFLLILFAFLIVGCGKKSDKDYFDSAEKSVNQRNIQEAIKSYETLIKEYPDSKLAPEALTKMASLYMNQSDSTLNRQKSFEKAAGLFREVYDKYPNSKQAPTALFMSGFVLSNDLNRYDQATMTYRLFLKKFPNHKLANSAKEELNNMGMSPEDILKKHSKAKSI